MLTCSLQSGSNGNCIYVEAGEVRLVFDAGISGRCAAERLASFGRSFHDVDALIVSHNHRDHVCGVGVLHRRFQMPVYVTGGSWQACHAHLGAVKNVQRFAAGEALRFGEVTVETIPTAHDGVEGVAFVVSHGRTRLGIFTDLGHPFAGLAERIAALDGVYLESNYDPTMLDAGPYPEWLKARIRGAGGHLSNLEAASLIRDGRGRLQLAILAHLSEHNNTPELALGTARTVVGSGPHLALASRGEPSELFALG
jgi:phosphoribosyl 1,2-cyclic phosphodiesterase